MHFIIKSTEEKTGNIIALPDIAAVTTWIKWLKLTWIFRIKYVWETQIY